MAPRAIADPVVMRASGVLVIQTRYVTPLREDPFYELSLAADELAARTTVVATRDRATYERALAAEGEPVRFDATWRYRKRRNGRLCLELTELAPALEEFTGRTEP